MLTAHRNLGQIPGAYRKGWVILDDDLEIVCTVKTKAEAQKIIDSQQPPKRGLDESHTIGIG